MARLHPDYRKKLNERERQKVSTYISRQQERLTEIRRLMCDGMTEPDDIRPIVGMINHESANIEQMVKAAMGREERRIRAL